MASAPAWAPARIIFRTQGRFRTDLPGAVDDAHAAAAQLAQDLIAGDGGDGAADVSENVPDIPGVVGVGNHTDRRVEPLGCVDGRLGAAYPGDCFHRAS